MSALAWMAAGTLLAQAGLTPIVLIFAAVGGLVWAVRG